MSDSKRMSVEQFKSWVEFFRDHEGLVTGPDGKLTFHTLGNADAQEFPEFIACIAEHDPRLAEHVTAWHDASRALGRYIVRRTRELPTAPQVPFAKK